MRMVIRGASPYATHAEQLADAELLAEQLRNIGFAPVEVEVVPSPAGAPMASGVVEWLMVYVGGPVVALGVADIYALSKTWVRSRITRPENRALRFGKVVIFGPDGEPLRQFQITQLPDGAVSEDEHE